jgi:hypothetical protein
VAGLLVTFDVVLAIVCAGAAADNAHRLPILDDWTAPKGAAPKQAADAPPTPIRLKRRDLQSAEELRQQLLAAPELDLDAEPDTGTRVLAAARASDSRFTAPVFEPLLKRDDLQGLPVAMGDHCRLGEGSARTLGVRSRELRGHLSASARDEALDASLLRQRLLDGGEGQWRREESVPALVQMLQAEEQPVRLLLVELLAGTQGRRASVALAGRALFDLSPEVREAAVQALADRPRHEFREVLLDGLRYPWAPVADHAAEALVALDDRESVPQLTALWDAPDPTNPARLSFHDLDPALLTSPPSWPANLQPPTAVVLDESRGGEPRGALLAYPQGIPGKALALSRNVDVVREVVRVNHLRNCLLCHAPSLGRNDPVRGLVPSPDRPLPPLLSATRYYEGGSGTFVRADVTYLRQDFSVPQPVARPGKWPVHQRYDYLVRTRYATDEDLRREERPTYPQRQAVRWALRELGGSPRANE